LETYGRFDLSKAFWVSMKNFINCVYLCGQENFGILQ